MPADHRHDTAAFVYTRSRALACDREAFDSDSVALALFAIAGGSPSTLEHALRMAERELERSPGDVRARLAVHLIGAAIRFLGPPNVRVPCMAAPR